MTKQQHLNELLANHNVPARLWWPIAGIVFDYRADDAVMRFMRGPRRDAVILDICRLVAVWGV